MLTLNGHGIIIMVDMAVLAHRTALQPVSRINLHTRLSSQDLQYSSAFRRVKFRCGLNLSRLGAVDYITVVITLAEFNAGKSALMSRPRGLAFTKSIGVPATSSAVPTGINVSSVGRNSEAFSLRI